MMNIKLAVAIALALTSIAAVAGEKPWPSEAMDDRVYGGPWFKAIDTDADGRLSEEELNAEQAILERLKDADQNEDNMISQEEYAAFETEMR